MCCDSCSIGIPRISNQSNNAGHLEIFIYDSSSLEMYFWKLLRWEINLTCVESVFTLDEHFFICLKQLDLKLCKWGRDNSTPHLAKICNYGTARMCRKCGFCGHTLLQTKANVHDTAGEKSVFFNTEIGGKTCCYKKIHWCFTKISIKALNIQ